MIPSVRFDEIYTANTCLYFASYTWVSSFARCRLTNDRKTNQRFFSFCDKNAAKFGRKKWILHTIIYHYMTPFGYMIMIRVDTCIIWFHLDYIRQLKQSYYIATNVGSRKSANTFGDLPDWLGSGSFIVRCSHVNNQVISCWKGIVCSIPGNGMFSPWIIMTSSNGNIFRITGHLCGEFNGPQWIPRTKASDAELWCFL